MDGWRRVHRILAVLFLLSIPPAAYFSFTGDPGSPHPVVYLPLFPLALMVITGTWMLVGTGVGFVVETARWRCPDGVAILRVADLTLSLPLALVWRKDNLSPLLSRFVTDVGSVVKGRPTTRQNGPLRDRL